MALMRQVVTRRWASRLRAASAPLDDLKKMVAAGATRIGASANVKIIEADTVRRRYDDSPKESSVRFRERAELLDFLLEVSRVTSETLDLDKLLENVASIVKEVVPYDLFAILLWTERLAGIASVIPSATAKRWSAAWWFP